MHIFLMINMQNFLNINIYFINFFEIWPLKGQKILFKFVYGLFWPFPRGQAAFIEGLKKILILPLNFSVQIFLKQNCIIFNFYFINFFEILTFKDLKSHFKFWPLAFSGLWCKNAGNLLFWGSKIQNFK